MTAPTALDIIAQRIGGADPDHYYRQAASFDKAAQLLADITDGFRGVVRQVDEAWLRNVDGDAPPARATPSAGVMNLLRELEAQDTAGQLRNAGDSLARAQVEIRDLQMQRMNDVGSTATGLSPYDEQARAVLRRVSEEFIELGRNLDDWPRAWGGDAASAGPPPPASSPMLSLASASSLADDLGRLPDPPGAPASLAGIGSASIAASAFDPTGAPPGGQPMTPFMPMGMGMGMGMGAQQGSRERHSNTQGSADPESWREPDDGWEVLGRRRPQSAPAPEQVALDAIDDLLRGGGSVLDRGGKRV